MRAVDVCLVGLGSFAAAYVAFAATWHPQWVFAFVAFAGLSLGLLAVRYLADAVPRLRGLHLAGNLWLLPTVVLTHFNLNPIVDSANPTLVDARLAELDVRIFGGHPSLILGDAAGPLLTELVLLCYYSYFLGPFVLGVILYLRRKNLMFSQYALGLGLFFFGNFILYVAVPAIGPRYFLAGMFTEPLQGVALTPMLEGLMRTPTFQRDCFPSGHTGVTLTVLAFAWRFERRFFWLYLPVGVGLIFGTLIGRFHYAIDLVAAVPLVATAVMISAAAVRAQELRVPQRALRAFRNLART